MKLTRIISVIISLVMCMSMIMPSYSVIADETPIPSETTKTEEIEKPTKETEKKIPKETEETTSDTEKKEIESSQTDTQNKDTTKESECGSSSDNKTKEETEAKESETSEPTNETEVKESDAPEPQEPETTKETEVNSTDKDEPEISTESGPTSVARRTAKNITTSEIQSKLRTKMSQTGYVPGGKPPSSYVNGATCYGFVDALCRYLFNHGLPSQASSKYALVSSGAFSQVGSTLTYSAGKTSASNLKSLFQNCQPGDVVQMNYFSDKAASGSADYHTLMIYSVSDSGVVFYHAGSSKVWYGGLWTTSGSVFTWSSFASWFGEAGDGISVYRSKQSNGVALPSSTWIKSSCGTNVTEGTNVTLTWGASNAESYWLHIYKDGSDYYNQGQNGNTSWSHTFTQTGTYTCYITPYGQSGYISSSEGTNASLTIIVASAYIPKPSDTWIKASCGSSVSVNTNVYLSWGATNAVNYWLHIYKDGADYYNAGEIASDKLLTFTQTGTYTCYITPFGQTGYQSASAGPSAYVTIIVYQSTSSVISGQCGDNLTWTLDSTGVFVISGSGNMYDYQGAYACPWWDYKENVKTVIVTNGVTSIGNNAFWNFLNATSFSLPDGLKTIGKNAFEGCISLTSIHIPESVSSIGAYAFNVIPSSSDNKFKDVYYEGTKENWNKIDINNQGNRYLLNANIHFAKHNLSLNNCQYGTASLSNSVSKTNDLITVMVFPDEYYELDYIKVNGNEIDGNTFKMPDCDVTVEVFFKRMDALGSGTSATVNGLRYQVTNAASDGTGTVTLIGVDMKQSSVSIPATVEINGYTYKVTRIGTKAFYGNKTITSLSIGSNVVIIDSYAFYGCSNLVKVSGGKVLKTIGSKAFAYCSKLKSFSISSSVLNKIGSYAFQKDKKLKTVYIKYTTKLTKSGVKKSLKSSSVKTVKVKKSKMKKYKKYFTKKNAGRKVKVKK